MPAHRSAARSRLALATLLAAAALLTGAATATATPTSLDVLSWSDEFDGSTLDASRWTYRASGPRGDGVLTPDAVSVADGALTIKTYTENAAHYSGMISTHKRDSAGFEQAYGYFEARIKFHSTPGQWSAFWLQSPTIADPLGDPGTAGVEMDVVEHRARCVDAPPAIPAATCTPTNDVSDRSQQALVWDGYGPQSQRKLNLSDPLPGLGNDSWHTWALRWTLTRLTFSYDDAVIWTATSPISRRAQYLILSSEVNRSFAGEIPAAGYGPRTSSTTNMQVDYVRAYSPATAPANTAAPMSSGTPEVGESVSCSSGTWTGNPTPALTYAWLRDGAAITGATSAQYVLQGTDARHELACRVIATNVAGSATAASNALLIRNRPLAPLTPPSVAALRAPTTLPATGARDRSAPKVRLTAPHHQTLRRGVRITIGCPQEACRATARGRVRTLWPAKAASQSTRHASARIAGGGASTVRLTLTRRALRTLARQLRHDDRVVMTVNVRVVDDAANARTLTRQISVRP